MDRRTATFFLGAALLFGGTFVGAKAGLDYFPPLLFVAIRFDIAALALIGYVALTTPRQALIPRTRGDVAGILATGALAIGLANALLFAGQAHLTSGVASILASLNPVLTPVFAGVLLTDERLSRRGALGLGLGLAGVALVVSPDPANLLAGNVLGKGLLLGSAAAGALGSVLIRRSDGDLSSLVRTAWGLPIAAALSHLLSFAAGESPGSVVWTPEALAALAYVALLSAALGYIAYFGLIDDVGAIRANLIFYLVPIVATVAGWALLGETISLLALAGFAVIFGGFAVLGSEAMDYAALARGFTRRGSLALERRLPDPVGRHASRVFAWSLEPPIDRSISARDSPGEAALPDGGGQRPRCAAEPTGGISDGSYCPGD